MIAVPPPQLVAKAPGLIHALRQSATSVGWMNASCHVVHVQLKGRVVRLGDLEYSECTAPQAPFFAVSGGNAIWTAVHYGNTAYGDVLSGAPGRTQRLLEETLGETGTADGDYVTGVASAGGRLFYSVLNEMSSDGCYGNGTPCVSSPTAKSRLMAVDGVRARKVPGLPPALRLAGGDDRLAVLVAPEVLADEPAELAVYRVRDMHRVATIALDGKVSAFAVSRSAAAVLVGRRLERFDGTGAALGATTVPTGVLGLSMSGTSIAFAVDYAIYTVDAVTGRTRVLVRRQFEPVGVSILGRRVIWAERDGQHNVSRVYALRAP